MIHKKLIRCDYLADNLSLNVLLVIYTCNALRPLQYLSVNMFLKTFESCRNNLQCKSSNA